MAVTPRLLRYLIVVVVLQEWGQMPRQYSGNDRGLEFAVYPWFAVRGIGDNYSITKQI